MSINKLKAIDYPLASVFDANGKIYIYKFIFCLFAIIRPNVVIMHTFVWKEVFTLTTLLN